jgi:hypothetical protein
MFKGKIVGLLGLLAQCAAICFWTYETGLCMKAIFSDPQHKQDLTGSVITILFCAIIAIGTAYCLYCRFKWTKENQRFTQWLIVNAEKIRQNQQAYFRSQRITPETELVCHHVVFSPLIVSTRTQTHWIIKGVEPRFWNAIAASLYTLFYGWWGIPFGLIWTPVAVVKNLGGMTTIRVSDLLQQAPPEPVGFKQRWQSSFLHDLHVGFFVDEKPAGILSRVQPTASIRQ